MLVRKMIDWCVRLIMPLNIDEVKNEECCRNESRLIQKLEVDNMQSFSMLWKVDPSDPGRHRVAVLNAG